MIGTLEIKVDEKLPRVGDRDDFLISIVGPGDTSYTKQASITKTLSSVWGLKSDDKKINAVEEMVTAIIKAIGTASEPGDFWFDTYNTEDDLDQTVRSIPNKPRAYIRGEAVRDEMTVYIGGEILNLLDDIEKLFVESEGIRFLNSLDRAFERSQAESDMNSPPKDKASYLYRVCILSVVLDRLNFAEYDPEDKNRSLVGFSQWLCDKYGFEFAEEVTKPLFKLRRLRNQYPIHEHYQEEDGQIITRTDLVEAQEFFNISGIDYASRWHKVSQSFKEAFEKIKHKLGKIYSVRNNPIN